jgi:signal transduction histidine kinase
MRLRTRLLLFFQGALAVVLVGFSSSLYLLASRHLHHQADERLDSALNTLAAAAEVNQSGVEWEPAERSLSFGRRAVEGGLLWRVSDDTGQRVDGSGPGPDAERLLDVPPGASAPTRRPVTVNDRSGSRWRVMHRRLSASYQREIGPATEEANPSVGGRIFPSLWLGAAVALDGVHETLNRLALVLTGLSFGLWLAMLTLGGRLCDRALKPVSAMASAAREIGGDHPDRRLPLPATQDELEDLGRSFNALLDRLQESFERQRRFSGDASHQLRTPLTAMLGNVDLALKQRRTLDEYERTLALVQRKARQMRGIIEALLFLARADAESLHPELERMDLAPWLEAYLRCRHDVERGSDVRLEIGPAGPFLVRAHPSLLCDLLENLLENAGKYSETGTPIVVHLGRDATSTSITITDLGIGIDEADMPHLFEPFYRSQAARGRAATGVGLGLSIALRLAQSLGATIEVTSRLGEGSSFHVGFPSEVDMECPVRATFIPHQGPTGVGSSIELNRSAARRNELRLRS